MPMSNAEKRAYGRGYQAGARWPEHKPPTPPVVVVRELVEALKECRDQCDTFRSMLCEDDEWAILLERIINRAETGLIRFSKWVKS